MASSFSNGVIQLDSSDVFVFYAGQVVSGSVQFELEEPITFSVIYLQLLGEANVSWTENEIETVHGVTNVKTVKYEGREQYFDYTINLAGDGSGVNELPPGIQSLPFKFQIPFTAPSSYKGNQGQVAYSMTAHLVVPEHIHAHEVITKNFTVIAPFDLNTGSDRIKEPIALEFDEVYGCGCFPFSACPSSDAKIRVRLPVSGYCPGQVIPVNIDVANNSTVEITKMIFEICSKELYRSHQPASEFIPREKVMMIVKKGPVMGKSKRNFTVDVPVPRVIPPYLENCSIIDVGYFFRVTIKLSGCNDDLQDEAEICLGLVPLQEFTTGVYVHPCAQNLPTVPIPDPNNKTEFLLPPPTPGFRGSHISLQKVQYSTSQSGAYQNNQGPYTDTQAETVVFQEKISFRLRSSMEMELKPFQDYNIGFKVPEEVPVGSAPGYPTGGSGYPSSGPGYPTSGPGYPTSGPGYPTSGPGYPTSGPGYPTSGPGYPTGGPGYPTGGPGYPTSGPGKPTNASASSEGNPPPYESVHPPYIASNPGTYTSGQSYARRRITPSAPPPSS